MLAQWCSSRQGMIMRRGCLLLQLAGCAPKAEWEPAQTDWVRHGDALLRAGGDAGDGKVELVWRLWCQGNHDENNTSGSSRGCRRPA